MTATKGTLHAQKRDKSATEGDCGGYTLAFVISDLPKSPNQLLGAHWTIRSAHAKKWLRAVSNAIMLNGRLPKAPLKRAQITCSRHSSGQSMDDDNLRGSFKSVIDALKKLGVIEDDSPKHVLINYTHEKAPPKAGFIRVRVEKLED